MKKKRISCVSFADKRNAIITSNFRCQMQNSIIRCANMTKMCVCVCKHKNPARYHDIILFAVWWRWRSCCRFCRCCHHRHSIARELSVAMSHKVQPFIAHCVWLKQARTVLWLRSFKVNNNRYHDNQFDPLPFSPKHWRKKNKNLYASVFSYTIK